jgi:hypothetical protein
VPYLLLLQVCCRIMSCQTTQDEIAFENHEIIWLPRCSLVAERKCMQNFAFALSKGGSPFPPPLASVRSLPNSFCLKFNIKVTCTRTQILCSNTLLLGHTVAQLVEVLCYKSKGTGSIPNGVIGIFHWHNPSSHTTALGLSQPLTEMSTRNISWG